MFTSVGSCKGKVEQTGEEASLANGGVKLGEGETEQARPTLTLLTRSPPAHPPPHLPHMRSPALLSINTTHSHYCRAHISIHLLDKQIIFEIDVVIVTGPSKLILAEFHHHI